MSDYKEVWAQVSKTASDWPPQKVLLYVFVWFFQAMGLITGFMWKIPFAAYGAFHMGLVKSGAAKPQGKPNSSIYSKI